MDTSTIETVLAFAGRWPILLSIVVAGAAGWMLTLVVERYFLPMVSAPEAVRRQKGFTFVLNWLLAAGATTLLLHALVPESRLVTRVEVALVSSLITAFVYPILARLATKRWPDIGSAWVVRE